MAPSGFTVRAFAENLDHPRSIYVLPNGDVLVAEADAPPKEINSLKDRLVIWVKQRAGSRMPSANRITLLRDADHDGVPELRTTFLENLNSPFGMVLVDNKFYVANTDAILVFPYNEGQTKITEPGQKLTDLPASHGNQHWTKNITASKDGAYLYAAVGSNSNIGENGMKIEKNRAGILEIERLSGNIRVYAGGLRNPVGMDWEPVTGKLWTAVNERDGMGGDLVPDFMTSVQEKGFYGWPYSYWGQNLDERVNPQNPVMVEKAITPDYALGAHTASLGLVFYKGELFPPYYHGGVFIGQHGSWNRRPHSGYKVIYIPFLRGKPTGKGQDFLTSFLNTEGEAYGRPVGVAVDKIGALLVADDVGDIIWRVSIEKRAGLN